MSRVYTVSAVNSWQGTGSVFELLPAKGKTITILSAGLVYSGSDAKELPMTWSWYTGGYGGGSKEHKFSGKGPALTPVKHDPGDPAATTLCWEYGNSATYLGSRDVFPEMIPYPFRYQGSRWSFTPEERIVFCGHLLDTSDEYAYALYLLCMVHRAPDNPAAVYAHQNLQMTGSITFMEEGS